MRIILKLATVAVVFLLAACETPSHMTSAKIDWEKRAKEVSVGMTRAEVSHILPAWNGSVGAMLTSPVVATINGSGQAVVYWVSQDWRVSIFYDYTGGESSDVNRVKKPVEIEKIRYNHVSGGGN